MENRYLFRAKRIDNGEWVVGNYQHRFDLLGNGEHYIFSSKNHNSWEYAEVDPSTICQCTGLRDKNGKMIWENDIIRCGECTTYVSWNMKYASWVLTKSDWIYHHFFGESQNPEDCEVIGNIFDNPELLEQEG